MSESCRSAEMDLLVGDIVDEVEVKKPCVCKGELGGAAPLLAKLGDVGGAGATACWYMVDAEL